MEREGKEGQREGGREGGSGSVNEGKVRRRKDGVGERHPKEKRGRERREGEGRKGKVEGKEKEGE